MEPDTKDIDIENLRQVRGFETFSDEELLRIAESIKEFTLLLNLIAPVDQVPEK